MKRIIFLIFISTTTLGASSKYLETPNLKIIKNITKDIEGLEKIKLINESMYDKYKQDLLISNGFSFNQRYDLNENGVKEYFIAVQNPKSLNSYLLVIEDNQLLHYELFEHPKLAVKIANYKGRKSILASPNIESEMVGDLIWEKTKSNYQFIFEHIDY